MHRHGYKGPKFGRQRDPRRALMKSLADSLILRGSIETTLPKAKAVASYTEKLITKAKKGDLHNRRQVISSLATLEAAHKLVDDLSPKLDGRSSGYFKIVRTVTRRGDNSQLARVSFVDDLAKKVSKQEPKSTKKTEKVEIETKPTDGGPKDTRILTKTRAVSEQRISTKTAASQAAKRTGRRGNR